GQIRTQEQEVRATPEPTQRRLVIEYIPHDRLFRLAANEEVVVIEAPEGTSHLGIAKMIRAIEQRNPACQPLPDSEVGRFPSNFLAETDQTADDASNRP